MTREISRISRTTERERLQSETLRREPPVSHVGDGKGLSRDSFLFIRAHSRDPITAYLMQRREKSKLRSLFLGSTQQWCGLKDKSLIVERPPPFKDTP